VALDCFVALLLAMTAKSTSLNWLRSTAPKPIPAACRKTPTLNQSPRCFTGRTPSLAFRPVKSQWSCPERSFIASHPRQIRRLFRSIEALRARDQGLIRQPASPPAVVRLASGRRQPRDAARANHVQAAAAVSSSSSPLAPDWISHVGNKILYIETGAKA
jgi:hypothetical protein